MKKIALFGVTALAIFSLAACSSKSSEPKKVDDSKTSQSSTNKEPKKTTFKVGETVDVDGVHFKVNKVDFNQGSTYSKPKDGNQYVLVNVTITNTSDKTTSYNPFDFKLDDNGNQTDLTETIVNDDGSNPVSDSLTTGSLSKGGSVTGTMVGQAKTGDKYKLVYTGNMFLDKEKVTFELN